MEEKENKNVNDNVPFSFKDLFINLKKKWIVTTIVGVVSLLLGCLGLTLYSKNQNTYVSNFEINWPGIENEQYPNGNQFNYKKIISLENLENIKASDEEFSNIDVEDMYNSASIEISQKLEEKVEGNSSSGYNYFYTITVDQRYFNDFTQATHFVKKVVENDTYTKASNEIKNYHILNYFKSQNDKTEYPEIVNNIDSQVNLQNTILSGLVKQSSQDFVYDTENNESLGDLLVEYNSFLKNNDYKLFESKMIEHKYVRNIDTYQDDFKNKIDAIDIQIKENERKIAALKDSFSGNYGDESVPLLMAELTLKNEDLKNQKIYFDQCLLGASFDEDFDKAINDYQDNILKFNSKIEKAYKAINNPKTYIEYNKNRVIIEDSMGMAKIGLFSLAFALVMEFILSLILTYIANKKRIA